MARLAFVVGDVTSKGLIVFPTLLAGLAVFTPLLSMTDSPDLRPLCIVAIGSSDSALVDPCIVRLEALRVTLPGVVAR